jgi:hypothetical protein
MTLSRGVVAAALAVAGGSAIANSLEAARSDAENGTRALETRPCPAFGDRNYLRGMSEAQQIAASADKERAYQETALRQLQQIARDPQLDQRQRSKLQALASWSVAASMANWSMLQLAQQAVASPLVAGGQPYPTAVIESARERVRRLAEGGTIPGEANEIVRRQARAIDRCVEGFSAAVFKLNQPQFDAAVDGAANLAELARIEQLYRVREASSAGQGGDSMERLAAKRAALVEADRIAREAANAANAADAAKRRAEADQRRAEADQRQAEARAKLPAYLAVAQRFAEAARSGNERAAINELARDVVMTTPQGTFRGIDQVVSAVRQQSASGRGGSLGTPQIADDRIISYGSSGNIRLLTTFGFDAENRIVRLHISL